METGVGEASGVVLADGVDLGVSDADGLTDGVGELSGVPLVLVFTTLTVFAGFGLRSRLRMA